MSYAFKIISWYFVMRLHRLLWNIYKENISDTTEFGISKHFGCVVFLYVQVYAVTIAILYDSIIFCTKTIPNPKQIAITRLIWHTVSILSDINWTTNFIVHNKSFVLVKGAVFCCNVQCRLIHVHFCSKTSQLPLVKKWREVYVFWLCSLKIIYLSRRRPWIIST